VACAYPEPQPPTALHCPSRAIRCQFGVLKLTLHPTGYDWKFVTIAGVIADSGTQRCH
jgi:hypothetical protein